MITPSCFVLLLGTLAGAEPTDDREVATWVLNQWGEVRVDEVPELLYNLDRFPKPGESVTLHTVILRNTAVTDKDLGRLTRIANLRRLALDGLRAGEVRAWNPYLHEGVPLSLPAVGYPLDLLQLLRPDEAGISLVLALHVPLAALGFYALARRLLDVPPVAAGGGALVWPEAPQYGVAPGQAAVLYDGTRVLGGGWIKQAEAGLAA